MPCITVILADDHTVVREGFQALLKKEADIKIVGEADTGRIAVEMAKQLQPNIVVMDVGMPSLNGMEAARQIRAIAPATKILIFSGYKSDTYVAQAIAAGADGYLLKLSPPALLIKAIRTLAKGERFFDPKLPKSVQAANLPEGKKKNIPLSSREVEILQLIAEGWANKQAADTLGLSIKTIEKHRQRLMDKLGIHNTAGLTRYALVNGIIEDKVQDAKT